MTCHLINRSQFKPRVLLCQLASAVRIATWLNGSNQTHKNVPLRCALQHHFLDSYNKRFLLRLQFFWYVVECVKLATSIMARQEWKWERRTRRVVIVDALISGSWSFITSRRLHFSSQQCHYSTHWTNKRENLTRAVTMSNSPWDTIGKIFLTKSGWRLLCRLTLTLQHSSNIRVHEESDFLLGIMRPCELCEIISNNMFFVFLCVFWTADDITY